tara:strand:+ start:2411 stop:2662 length:252 start_codon:yes stop_codon:yes gene_type:complete
MPKGFSDHLKTCPGNRLIAAKGAPDNGSFRAECLNTHWFMSLDDAREKLEVWRRDYNEVRPHSAIGNKPPIAMLSGSCGQLPA